MHFQESHQRPSSQNAQKDKAFRRISFCTLAGVEDVHLEGDEVVGRWNVLPHPYYPPSDRSLAQKFATWPSGPDLIVRFAQEHGPLDEPQDEQGREFRFTLEQWSAQQRIFRHIWESLSKSRTWRRETIPVMKGESLGYQDGELFYKTRSLWRFLELELRAYPRERVRICARSDCPNLRYFIAGNLRQLYCCAPCARWAQKQWKLRWWNEEGKRRRAEKQKEAQRKKGKFRAKRKAKSHR